MTFTLTRAQYLPSDAKKIDFADDRIEGYVGDRVHPNGVTYPVGIVFVGKAQKPSFIYRFKSTEEAFKLAYSFMLKMQVTLDDRELAKAERKAKRNVSHTMKVGDILVSSWGYDQTNVNFYQVVGVRGKQSVELREIASAVDHSSVGSDYVVPVKDSFLTPRYEKDDRGKVFVKRVHEDQYVNISSYEFAYRWEGKPMYETACGWGH